MDLHTHTNYSDGSLNPEELVDLAIKRKVKILAITDHGNISGIREAVNYSKSKNIKIISGIEINAEVNKFENTVHIVGLNMDINNLKLKKLCKHLDDYHKLITKKKLEVANNYFNSSLTYQEIQKKTKGIPGSFHILETLMEKGYIKSIEDGIKIALKNNLSKVNIKEKIVNVKQVIQIIHNSGGIAILGHLSAYKYVKKFETFKEQEELVKKLVDYGLDGMEIYIPNIIDKEFKFCKKLAKKYNLLTSCGSDFHDEKRLPDNKLGLFDKDEKEVSVLNVLKY